MDQILRKWLHAGSYSPVVVGFSLLVLVVATGAVAASPVWSHRILRVRQLSRLTSCVPLIVRWIPSIVMPATTCPGSPRLFPA